MSLAYEELFSKWEINLTRKIARQYKNKWRCLNKDSIEDLMQECLIHWYYNRDKYDPALKKSEKSFMGWVLKNKLADIVKEREREKRRPYFHSVSLEKLTKAIESKFFADPSYKLIQSELAAKLKTAYQKLTPRQQEILRLLSDENLSAAEISKRLNMGRRTVYDELERIRAVFGKEGLRDYLK